MTVRFLLVCEGSSDAALIPHISRLLIHYGQPDPEGSHWSKSGPLIGKIQEGLSFYGDCDLLFLHRDADSDLETQSAGPKRRHTEIYEAVRDSGFTRNWVGIVPVRMTEAWLLVNESSIRYVAGRPRSNTPLDLPSLRLVEHEPDPKARLTEALITASGTSGRDRKRFIRAIPSLRHQLLQDLPVGGLLEQVPSWVRFREDLIAALTRHKSPDHNPG